MESITWLVDRNRLSPVKKVQVRFVASDRRVVCDHVASEQHSDSEIRLDSDSQSFKMNHLSETRDQLTGNLAGFNRKHITTVNRNENRDTDTKNDAIKLGHTRTDSGWYSKNTGEPYVDSSKWSFKPTKTGRLKIRLQIENPYSECRN